MRDKFSQSNDTSLTWQKPSKMLRLQVTREDKMFLLHNRFLLRSKGWTSKPSTAETGQHTGQWKPAIPTQRFWTYVLFNSFVECLKVWLSSVFGVCSSVVDGNIKVWSLETIFRCQSEVQSSKFVQLSCDVAWLVSCLKKSLFLPFLWIIYSSIPFQQQLYPCQSCGGSKTNPRISGYF